MRRKDILYILASLIVCIITGCILLATWVIVVIPALIHPSLIPDPRPALTAKFTRFGMRQMMKGAKA